MSSDRPLLYPMRLVSKMTGLTADTIRAWERRYRAVEPDRSAGNTRRFSAEDVKRLTLLRDATNLGHTIATVASLETNKLEELVTHGARLALSDDADDFDAIKIAYLNAVTRFETSRAMDMLRRSAATLDPRDFALRVAVPIVEEVGDRWAHGALTIAQEHTITFQLSALLTALPMPSPQGARLLLALPAGHRHQFGLLVGGILARLRSLDVVNLGADIPFVEILWATEMARPRIIVTSIVRDPWPGELDLLTEGLEDLARLAPVWIGCPSNHALVNRTGAFRYFHDFVEFDRALTELA